MRFEGEPQRDGGYPNARMPGWASLRMRQRSYHASRGRTDPDVGPAITELPSRARPGGGAVRVIRMPQQDTELRARVKPAEEARFGRAQADFLQPPPRVSQAPRRSRKPPIQHRAQA